MTIGITGATVATHGQQQDRRMGSYAENVATVFSIVRGGYGMYIDDAMNEGAFIPEPTPKRCRIRHVGFASQQQVAIDGSVDLLCARCGAVVVEKAEASIFAEPEKKGRA